MVRRAVNGGPGAARNTGLAAADTPLVAFLDSDCAPGPGWLDALLPHFADPAVGAVAPRIVPAEPGRTWLARYEGASSTLDMGARASIVRPGSRVPYVPGAALVVRRAAAGTGFAETMRVGEDVDFVWRLAASGWRVRYEPAAAMRHQHRVRLREWFARRKDYGTSAAVLEQRHPGTVRPLYVSAWTALAWLAAAAGHPAVGAACTGAGVALLARRLAQVTGEDWPTARTRLAAGGPAGRRRDARGGPAAGQRDLPDLVAGGTGGRGGRAGCGCRWPRWSSRRRCWTGWTGGRRWTRRATPPRDCSTTSAYSLGVWQGCAGRRTVRPLLPRLGSRHLDIPRANSAGTMTSSGDRS